MIVIVSTVRVHSDKAETFEKLCQALLAKIRANEPGTIFYTFARSRDEPDTYRVIEVYKDRAAQEFHLQASYLAEAAEALSVCFAAPPAFIVHDSIA